MVMKNTGKHCRDGLIISAPEKNLFNTIICLFGLLYCFIGVATASNIFMRSIERIASTTRYGISSLRILAVDIPKISL